LTTTLKIGKDNFEKNNFSGGSSTMKQFAVYADQVNVECNDFTGSFTHPFDW